MLALRGAYGGAGPDGLSRLAALDRWTRSPTMVMSDGLARDNWANCVSVADWAAQGWAKTPRMKAVSTPLCMLADAGGADLAGAAAGAYDAQYAQLLHVIANRKVGPLVLRPGWEFNGNWYSWGSGKTVGGVATAARAPLFVQAFRRQAALARQIIPGVLICWNPAQGNLGVPTQNYWPGDDVVDLIGMDLYNTIDPDQPTWTDAQRWTFLKTMGNGLDWLASFAAAHGKPICFPEVGSGWKKGGGGVNVSRDSAYFVQQFAAWVAAHNVLFWCWFHYPAGDGQWQLGADVPLWPTVPGTGSPGTAARQFPAQSAAYLAAFGGPMSQISTDYSNLAPLVAAVDAAAGAVTTAVQAGAAAQQMAQASITAAQTDLATKKAALQAAMTVMGNDLAAV